jgi:hypothetical protein
MNSIPTLRYNNVPIGVLEHAILQTDYNKLAPFEACFDQAADVLGVRQI